MAEINSKPQNTEGKGRVRSKKRSTQIDMTPMVDLAFLLLTFFMLANTFLDPKVMDVAMPDKGGDTSPVNNKNVLTVALGENNKVYYALGDEDGLKMTDFSSKGLRKVLIDAVNSNPEKLYVRIKPTDKSTYQNLVDAFDEMAVTDVPRYALVEVTLEDLKSIEMINQ